MQKRSTLIVTLLLDENAFLFFDDLRKNYFPPAINYLSAHLTLFHHLPPNEPSLQQDLEAWSKEHSPLPLQVTDVKNMGKGVAYGIDCPALLHLHKTMQKKWKVWLTPQDKQRLWPHITVQNKVPVEEARKTLKTLQDNFQPFSATGLGFRLWAYEGGPWRFISEYRFLK